MLFENQFLLLGVSVFWISTIVFVVFYLRGLRAVGKEYVKAQTIVEDIVITFRRRYDDLSSNVEQLKTQIMSTQSSTKEVIDAAYQLNKRIENRLETISASNPVVDTLQHDISTLQEDIKQLKYTQHVLETKLSNTITPPVLRDNTKSSPTPGKPVEISSSLTETENTVLQFLVSNGPKTARDVEAKIGKTREHTARLMKKLWQQGYVERETHRVPFTYRAAAALRDLEKPSS